jgi:hypothetical protein
MLGTTMVPTLVVVTPALNDWVIHTLTCCFWVSTTIAFYTIGEVVLTWNQCCSSMWLHIDILYGVVCGCECPFGYLLMV